MTNLPAGGSARAALTVAGIDDSPNASASRLALLSVDAMLA